MKPLYIFNYIFTCIQMTCVFSLNSSGDNPIKDDFTKQMCRERFHRMDWVNILKPCENKLAFNTNIYRDRTNAKLSIITNKNIRNAGEYSSFKIKTYDMFNSSKRVGGDTWRVFIKGAATLEPYVYDQNNGEYEVYFLLMEPGQYRVIVALEGSSCSSFVNPPSDWFQSGDYNGHFQQAWRYSLRPGWSYLLNERTWLVLDKFQINLPAGNAAIIQKAERAFQTDELFVQVIKHSHDKYEPLLEHKQQLNNWQEICDLNKCRFISDGLGRWVGHKWKPFADKVYSPTNSLKNRKNKGLLWIYGDCYAHHFWQSIHNSSLCTQQFNKCNSTYNWIYPRWDPDPTKDKSLHLQRHNKMDIPWLVEYFDNVLSNPELNKKDSGMFLNLGLHFIRSSSFHNYAKLIDEYINVIKQHKTNVIWRTTTSIYRAEHIAHKRFQTNQRALLFNAYAMSAMCRAGIPIIDVFPMTSSYPHKPLDGIHFDVRLFTPVKNSLKKYYKYV